MHRLDVPRHRVELDDPAEDLVLPFEQAHRVQDGGEEVERTQDYDDDVLHIAEAGVDDAEHQAEALREEQQAEQDRERENPGPADIAQPQEHDDQHDEFQQHLDQLHDGGAKDGRPGGELHLLQQLAIALELAHREREDAGEEVPGDQAGEQEGGVGTALAVAEFGGLDPEDDAEDGREDHQGGQGLDEGPGPAEHAGAVPGGEITVGEGPDQGALRVQGAQHGLRLALGVSPSLVGNAVTSG